jgi:hypothetical protein
MRRKTARTPCKPGPGGPDRYEINNAGACCALASQPSGAGHAATTWRWAHVGVVPSGCLLCARLRPGHAPLSACFQCSARLCRISWSSCRRTYLRLVRAGQPPQARPHAAVCLLRPSSRRTYYRLATRSRPKFDNHQTTDFCRIVQ